MKRTLFAITALGLLSTPLFSQEGTYVPRFLQNLPLTEKTWISNNGFPLTEYKFSDNGINAALQLALELKRKGKKMNTIGYIAMGAGILIPVVAKGSQDTETLTGAYVGGTVAFLGGLGLNLVGMSKRKKAAEQVQQAAYLYKSGQ